jgi:hypothetical protein
MTLSRVYYKYNYITARLLTPVIKPHNHRIIDRSEQVCVIIVLSLFKLALPHCDVTN